MLRDIIEIDEEKCVGCGLCVNACDQGALVLKDGKAKLVSDSYCDGLGKCLPTCPTGALKVVQKEVDVDVEDKSEVWPSVVAKDKSEVWPSVVAKDKSKVACDCPSTAAKKRSPQDATAGDVPSQLKQWPCQIKLVSVNAPYLKSCNLLIAADCSAFSYGNFHNDFMQDKITLIGCPKLDDGDYSNKLSEIIRINNIKNLTVVRMSVPCCGGLVNAANLAIEKSGCNVNLTIQTISIEGELL